MAAEAGAFSYGDSSNREDLSDQIRDINATEDFVTSTSETVPVTNQIHSWVSDPIAVTSSQAGVAQNTDTSYAATNPTTMFNTLQKIEKGIAVDSTSEGTDHAGFTSKFAREKVKKMEEWKQQLEFSAVAGALVSGTGTAGSTMAGIAAFASPLTSTLASGVSLTSAMLNDWLGNAWDQGADHDTILAPRALKERISMFTQNTTQQISAKEYTSVGKIDIYISDHGQQEVIKHRYVDNITGVVTHGLVTYIQDYVKVGVMDSVHYEDRAKTGMYKKGAICGAYTMEVANNKAVACYKLVK
jgi:hypothetical protein